MSSQRILRGIPASSGFGIGTAFLYRAELPVPTERRLAPHEADGEVRRLAAAVAETGRDLAALKQMVTREMGADLAEFISVQVELLRDRDLLDQVSAYIREHLVNAEFAYATVVGTSTAALKSKPFFRERLADVSDVTNRLLRHLAAADVPSILGAPEGAVIIARELLPSETALLDRRRVRGIATELGGKTSHTSIMTRALEIPAVVGITGALDLAAAGQQVIVDGQRGLLILSPTAKRVRFYESEHAHHRELRASLAPLRTLGAVTTDGRQIDLSANIEFLSEVSGARAHGARGIGLFRTEYLYLARRRAPSEDEQYEVYAELARRMKPDPVIIRTFDLGGDKVEAGHAEPNPFLGWRAIRYCIDNPDFFKKQLRAILRATRWGNVKILFPMVATLEELRRARLILDAAKRELTAQRIAFDAECEVGIMVEIPSSALIAPALARSCDYFSIGSNDLTQYALAVDRGNERVARLYDHFHPAVLALIRMTIQAAHDAGIWVGMCGEMAADPLAILLLIGLGIDELSMAPPRIPAAKRIIRSIESPRAREIAARAIDRATPLEVRRFLERETRRQLPELARFIFEEKSHA